MISQIEIEILTNARDRHVRFFVGLLFGGGSEKIDKPPPLRCNRLISREYILRAAIAIHVSPLLTDDAPLSTLMTVSPVIKATRGRRRCYRLSTRVPSTRQRLSADFNGYHLTPQLPLRRSSCLGVNVQGERRKGENIGADATCVCVYARAIRNEFFSNNEPRKRGQSLHRARVHRRGRSYPSDARITACRLELLEHETRRCREIKIFRLHIRVYLCSRSNY